MRLVEEAKVASEAKVTLEEDNAKLKAEKAKFQQLLQESQDDLQTLQCIYATMSGKVIGLEEVKAAEESDGENNIKNHIIILWAVETTLKIFT